MRTLACLLLAMLLAATTPVAGDATDLAEIHMDFTLFGLPYASCDVAVPTGANGGDALDAAVDAGCITEWTYTMTAGGRFLTGVDGITGDTASGFDILYWSLYENGGYASTGIDGYVLEDGDVLGFDYTTWIPYLLPTL